MKRWARLLYQPSLPLRAGEHVTGSAGHIALSKAAALEGMVLLKNEGNILPFEKGKRLAVFGKGSFDYVKGGGGSGDVGCAYVHSLQDGFKSLGDMVQTYAPLDVFYEQEVKKQYAEGSAPGMTVEPEVSEEMLRGARAFTDTALFVISRFSGEGWDRSSVEYTGEYNPWESETSMPKISGKIFPEGDFYLTANEKKLLAQLGERFENVVAVLNVGGMIDTSWIRDNKKVSGALLAWQGGMEGGIATAELLFGLTNPSGKLPDTFADSVDAYPSTEGFHESFDYVNYTEDIYVGYRYFETLPGAKAHVVYPFGFGLSYTQFTCACLKADHESGHTFLVQVTNVGARSGKEVVQLYAEKPQGKLGKPSRELVAFAKTRSLAPGESQVITLQVSDYTLSSYDDLGKVQESAYVLEQGTYRFYLGGNVEDAVLLDADYTVPADQVICQLSRKGAPVSLKKRLLSDGSYEELPLGEARDINVCVFEKMKAGTEEAIVPRAKGRDPYLLMNPYKEGVRPLEDVAEGKLSLDDFIAQLSDADLISLLGGQPNVGVSNTWCFGNLPEYGVPSVPTADGPAGVRIGQETGVSTTAFPCATLMASTWNVEMAQQVGLAGGEELKENNLGVWLTPAVNIHRNPLCGRNFEYYSEDPLLTGKMAAALVKGIQSNHVGCSVKHFCCNNKETNRKNADSRVSERALREIYLKAFEIIVKEADPWTIMSGYNVVNGYRASENKELLEDVLRGEWGFQGMVTSDWWNRAEHYKEILAGNDVKMACGFPERVEKAMELGALSREDLVHCARRVLSLVLRFD
ncbi:MAG: glycoside hydrolase family 3 C-terminal domain-containing protein [Lachnospiraceae bacterium]|nr:glycoside hydrolase family 3 C-terminal domain-containing protein [Lachnospiraceae bacterium]